MLDTYYPSLAALVAACREIRSYLRAGNHNLPDTPDMYNITTVLYLFEEVATWNGSEFVVIYHTL